MIWETYGPSVGAAMDHHADAPGQARPAEAVLLDVIGESVHGRHHQPLSDLCALLQFLGGFDGGANRGRRDAEAPALSVHEKGFEL